jgi:hypothetical protein
MAIQTFQVLYTSDHITQVNETFWKKIINLILIKKYLRPYFNRQPGRNIFLYS